MFSCDEYNIILFHVQVIDECRQNIASDQFMIGRLQQEIDLLKKIIEKEESCIEQQGESQDTEGKAAATSSNVGTSPTAVTGTTQKRNTAKRTPAATSIAAVIDSKKKPTAKRTATSLTSVKDSKKPATESPATSLTSVKDSKKPATESPATSLISVKDSKEPATESPATSLTAVKDSKKPATESPATSLTEVKDTEAQEVTKERPASPLTAVKDTEAQDTSLRRSNRIRSRGEKRPLPQRVPTKSKKKKVEQATTEKEEPVPTQPQAAKPVEAPKKPTSTLPPPQRQAAPSAREKPIATHTVTADSQSRPSPRKQAATPPQRQAAPEQPIAMPTVPADPPASLPIPHSPAEQSLTIKNPSPTKLPKPAHSTEVPKTSTPRKKTATPTATPTKQPTRADATETNKATKPKSKKETPTATPTKQTTKADATETVKAPTPTKQPTTRDATETVKAPTPTKQPTTADATETVKAPKKTTSDDKPRAEGLTKSQRTFSGHVNRILLNSSKFVKTVSNSFVVNTHYILAFHFQNFFQTIQCICYRGSKSCWSHIREKTHLPSKSFTLLFQIWQVTLLVSFSNIFSSTNLYLIDFLLLIDQVGERPRGATL